VPRTFCSVERSTLNTGVKARRLQSRPDSSLEELFGDTDDQEYEQRIDADWKKSLAASADRRPAAGRGAFRDRAEAEPMAGYDDEVTGHLEAAVVQNGDADAGVTIRVAAEAYGLDSIGLREERYDLAISEAKLESAPVNRMLDALNSRRFAREVAQLCAYDATRIRRRASSNEC
jgi:hypothetical protein